MTEFRREGFPKTCICGEAVVMRTSRTARNHGRLFHACPNGSEEVTVWLRNEDRLMSIEPLLDEFKLKAANLF